jgi:hypothetical protein
MALLYLITRNTTLLLSAVPHPFRSHPCKGTLFSIENWQSRRTAFSRYRACLSALPVHLMVCKLAELPKIVTTYIYFQYQ